MPCPELAELEELAAGRAASAELRFHVDSCADCRKRSDEIAADNQLVSRLGELVAAELVPMAAPAAAPAALPEIDGYRVIAELHRGGQGIVYEGVQLSTKRKVALKVLLDGALASATQVARFDREIETVLKLRHVNVVALLDQGRARDGRLFFAMEFVEGVSLDEFANERRAAGWTARDAVALFVKICGAVHYAHQHGVVHRDLKPGNVRVDPAGEPRVLDFGLAKGVDASAAAATVTRPGWFVGTLAYASPEQLRGAADAVDARSDVFSLGVVLFELVTGALPHPAGGALPDVVRAITEVEPRVPKSVDADLAAILGRALEKERDPRYASAGELAADLERWLRGEAVDAQRGRLGYLLRKAVRRHRVRFALAAAMLVVLVGAAIFSTFAWARARSDAERARIDARTRSRVTQMVESMLLSLDPERARERAPTVREVLDDAVRRLDAGPREEPAVEAEVRATMGVLYGTLGRLDDAQAQFDQALALSRQLHPDGDESLALLLVQSSDIAYERSEYEKAQRQIEEAMAQLEKLGRADSPTLDLALNELGRVHYGQGQLEAAEQRLARALVLRRARSDTATIAVTLVDLSQVEMDRRRFADAESNLREALQIRRARGEADAGSTAATLRALERLLLRLERYDEARTCIEEAIAIDRGRIGGDDPVTYGDEVELAALICEAEGYAAAAERHQGLVARRGLLDGRVSMTTAYTLGRLARLARDAGDLAASESDGRAALAIYAKLVGPDHRSAVALRAHLAWVAYQRGHYDEAVRLGRETVAALRKAVPVDEAVLGGATLDLAWMELEIGRVDEAEARARESLELRERVHGEEHGATARSRNALAWVLHVRGQDDEAEELLLASLERQTLRFGERSTEVATTLQQRAAVARARGEFAEAEEAYRRCVELRRELLGATSPDLAMALDLFGWFLIERKRVDEAGPLLQEALAIRRARLDEGHPLLGWSLNNLGVWHYWRRELAAAEERIGEAVAQARAHDATGNAGFPVWLGNLGAVKLAQRDFAAAEPQLLEAHRLLLALRGPRHPQTASVAASLVTLFTSIGRPERAAEFAAPRDAARAGAPR